MTYKMCLLGVLYILFTYSLCVTAEYTVDPAPYAKQAKLWIEQYVCSEQKLLTPAQDIQTLANIIYFSYYRSKSTLDAQEASLLALRTFWNNHENIAATRRNPSRMIPHPIDMFQQKAITERSIYKSSLHRSIGQAYAHITKAGVNENLLNTSLAFSGLNALRSDARVVITQTLLDVRALLGKLYYTIREQADQLGTSVRSKEKYVRSAVAVIDFVCAYIPQLAIKSLVDADNFNNLVSAEGWQTLMAIQDISYQTWLMIEQSRASFYQAHYQALYAIMQEYHLATEYYHIIVDEHGLITTKNRTTLLPTPERLP